MSERRAIPRRHPGEPRHGGQSRHPGQPRHGGQSRHPGEPRHGGQSRHPGEPRHGGQSRHPGQPRHGGQSRHPGQPRHGGQPRHPGELRQVSRPGRRGRRGSSTAGYTMIEVMMALAVLTAGAVGIMALQSAATRGTLEARQMTTGSMLAQRWVERLRRDNLNWVTGSDTANPLLLNNTIYLRNVAAPGDAAPWFVPTPAAATNERASFDFYGNDTTVPGEMRYCTNVRLEWLYPGRAMRADVRVWWLRRVTGASVDSTRADLVGCGGDPAALTNDWRVRMAYASTVLRYQAN